jgi:hypothetical protein
MSASKFTLSYPARTQLSLREKDDKDALSALFAGDPLQGPEVTRPIHDGRFVSQTGRMLVLWRQASSGLPEILSIVDRSYLPEPG